MSEIKFNAIAAVCVHNNGIGNDKNDLPWSIPEDFQYFLKVVTTRKDTSKLNAVIAGRNTWESIEFECRPVNNCLNFIISNKMTTNDIKIPHSADLERIIICKSINEAIELINTTYRDKIENAYAIGGSSVYREFIMSDYLHRFYLTRVLDHFDCSVFMKPDNYLDYLEKLNTDSLVNESNMFQCQYNVFKTDPTTSTKFIFECYKKKN